MSQNQIRHYHIGHEIFLFGYFKYMLNVIRIIKCYKYINLIYVNAIQCLLFSSSFQFNIIALTSQNMKYIGIIYDRKIHNIQILWSIQIYRIITYNNRAPIQIRNFCKYLLNRYDYVRKFSYLMIFMWNIIMSLIQVNAYINLWTRIFDI